MLAACSKRKPPVGLLEGVGCHVREGASNRPQKCIGCLFGLENLGRVFGAYEP